MALLETALGGRTLRSLAETATKNAEAGYWPGRPGRTYTGFPAEAAVDAALAKLEDDRDEAMRERAVALAAAQRSQAARILGIDDDGEAQRRLKIAQSQYDELDQRIAIVTSLGRPLARRHHLVNALAIAEAELVAIDTQYCSIGKALKWAQEPESDEYVIPGQPAKKRAVLDKERSLKARLDDATRDVRDARFALRRWDTENAQLAFSLERAAPR